MRENAHRTSLSGAALILAALGLSGASVHAQSVARSNGAGQVVDRDGKGVPGAEVTLVHRPIPWCADYGEADVVHGTTDASGRFRVQLLPRRSYSAFAAWRIDRTPKVTDVGQHVIAGAFAMLREQQDAITERTFKVEGLEPWAAFGPFTYRVVPRLPDLYLMPVSPGADGTITVPPLPGNYAVFEVVTATGATLWQGGIGFAPDSTWPVRIPPPVEVPLEVRRRRAWHAGGERADPPPLRLVGLQPQLQPRRLRLQP